MIRLLALLCTLAAPAMADAQAANRLAGSASPYLLQHAENPVDWHPWGAQALALARSQGKPIFVSVGYSSCHWCHVMREESFEDEAIAALLNRHFVAIKIDRETRPDLDEQFMVATQILTGTGGWPNSVFLTPEGQPFAAGGYFPPDAFANALAAMADAWASDPGFLRAQAARVTRTVTGYLAQVHAEREVTGDDVAAATAEILSDLDPFHGGFGVAPKFPREPVLLFLLDRAERTGDPETLAAVTLTLDALIMGGIHDHVGGGFHRYSIDNDWHIPHFEKMLYNQALIGRLLTRAARITGAPRYARAADRLFAYVLREMRDPGGAFHSAQDADSLNAAGDKAEGAFYLWTPAQFDALGSRAEALREVFQVTPHGELDGANVLNLAALPPPGAYAVLDAALDELADLRRRRPAPFLDRKIIASWNAEMIATLAEAGATFDRPDLTRAATRAAAFLHARLGRPDGLARLYFEGTAMEPAQLADTAALGLAYIALHDHGDPGDAPAWLARAMALARDMGERFGGEGAYRMTETADGLGKVLPLDDTEIPSGNALALALLTAVTDRAEAPDIDRGAHRLAAALGAAALDQPAFRAYALKALQDLTQGTTGPTRFAAHGAVRIDAMPGPGSLTLALTMAPGWHVNAHEPLEDYFIPTALTATDTALTVTYPDPAVKSLAFSDRPLALYEGRTLIAATLPDTGAPIRLTLTLQACSDEICLQPEDMGFTIWPTP